MPDIAELKRILSIIQDESKMPAGTSWNQGYWFKQDEVYVYDEDGKDTVSTCGTAMCFAGWKVYLDGYTKLVKSRDSFGATDYAGARMFNPETNKYVTYWSTRDYARDALGLTDEQADLLFAEDNTLEDLENIVNDIESEAKIDAWVGSGD